MQHIELMAPAGNFESLQAALDNGADSVYFGVEQLNMRARASINFTLKDLPEIAKRCKAKNVRTYHRHGQMVQRNQRLRFHLPRGWRRRVCSLLRNPG